MLKKTIEGPGFGDPGIADTNMHPGPTTLKRPTTERPSERVKINPVMYLFVNKSLGMSPGKLAAQVAHAACLAQKGSKKELVDAWYQYGFYTKLVMEARDEQHVKNIENYLAEREIKTFIVIDEGRTEIKRHTITALGVEVVDKNVVGPIFQEFKLFKPELTLKVKWND